MIGQVGGGPVLGAIGNVWGIRAALAVGVGAVCLTCAAYIVLARNLDPAAAWGILGAFWGVAGLLYFAVASRRRG